MVNGFYNSTEANEMYKLTEGKMKFELGSPVSQG